MNFGAEYFLRKITRDTRVKTINHISLKRLAAKRTILDARLLTLNDRLLSWEKTLGSWSSATGLSRQPRYYIQLFQALLAKFVALDDPSLTDRPNLEHETMFPGATTIITAINFDSFVPFPLFLFLEGTPHRKPHEAQIIGLLLTS